MRNVKYQVRWDERVADEYGEVTLTAKSESFIALLLETAYDTACIRRDELIQNADAIRDVLHLDISNVRVVKVTEVVVG